MTTLMIQPSLLTPEMKTAVSAAFDGFIGNADAVHTIQRNLKVALMRTPVSLDRTFLFVGPPSVGKTELARRIVGALGLPFLRIDGRMVRTREKLFKMIDELLIARQIYPKEGDGKTDGLHTVEYPPFGVFVDEVQTMCESAQESLLTMLENDDRSVVLDGETRRRVNVKQATFIFATTKPSELDRAFRSRCMEIVLQRYSLDEVMQMVRARYPQLPDLAIERAAGCSRRVPRRAFDLAREIEAELLISEDDDVRNCIRRVCHGQGILYGRGETRNDVRYMNLLKQRPLGETAIAAHLHDVERDAIGEDIEPFLLDCGYIEITPKGRALTRAGLKWLSEPE